METSLMRLFLPSLDAAMAGLSLLANVCLGCRVCDSWIHRLSDS